MSTYCLVCEDSGEIALKDVYSKDRFEICDTVTELCAACPRCDHCDALMRDSLGKCGQIYEGDWACSPECAALMISGEPVLEAIEFSDVIRAAELLSDHTSDGGVPSNFPELICITRAIELMAKYAASNLEEQARTFDSGSALVEFARDLVRVGGAA